MQKAVANPCVKLIEAKEIIGYIVAYAIAYNPRQDTQHMTTTSNQHMPDTNTQTTINPNTRRITMISCFHFILKKLYETEQRSLRLYWSPLTAKQKQIASVITAITIAVIFTLLHYTVTFEHFYAAPTHLVWLIGTTSGLIGISIAIYSLWKDIICPLLNRDKNKQNITVENEPVSPTIPDETIYIPNIWVYLESRITMLAVFCLLTYMAGAAFALPILCLAVICYAYCTRDKKKEQTRDYRTYAARLTVLCFFLISLLTVLLCGLLAIFIDIPD